MEKRSKFAIIIITVILIIAVVTIVLLSTFNNSDNGGEKTKESLKVSSVDDLKNLIEEIYKKDKPLPTLETREIDLSESSDVEAVTGCDNGDDFEYLAVSEPMISSQAYSLVIGKVKSGVDANKVAKEMNENVNPRKWICVSAEKVCTTNSGDIVFLVMTDKSTTESVYNEFKKLAGKVGKEYSRDVQETEFEDEFEDDSYDDENSNDTEIEDGLGQPVISLDEIGASNSVE